MASAPLPKPLSEDEVMRLTADIARQKGIPPEVLFGLIKKESMGTGRGIGGGFTDFNPMATGDKGKAFGLGQLHRGAMQDVGMNPSLWANPDVNVNAAADYLLKQKGKFSDWRQALAAYNAGAGNVGAGAGYAEAIMGPGTPPGAPPAPRGPALAAGGPPPGGPPPGGGGPVPPLPPPPYRDERLAQSTMQPPNMSMPGQGAPPPTAAAMAVPPEPPVAELPQGKNDLASLPPGGLSAPFSSSIPLSIGNGIIPLGSKPKGEGGGGFSGFLGKVGGALKQALPFLIGGPAYAMGRLMQGPAEERMKRLEEWKSQREQKAAWENAQVEQATKIMEDLQGVDLNELIAQEKDPQKQALLTQAAEKIRLIGKKYADVMDPSSEGGSMITPKEAGDLLQMRSMFREPIEAVMSAKADVGAREAGRREGLTAESKAAELRRRADAGDPVAQAEMARIKAAGATIDVEVGGGKTVPMTVDGYAAFHRGMYYANQDRIKKDPNSQMAQAWLSKNAQVLAMLEMDRSQAVVDKDRKRVEELTAQINELERMGQEIAQGKYSPRQPGGLPQGYTLERSPDQ